MGYSHGVQWTDEAIEKGIREVMDITGTKEMPSCKLIKQIIGDYGLAVAIGKHGGYDYWANKLNLKRSNSETHFGKTYEKICLNTLIDIGYDCETTSSSHPYDILANNVKIDVKVSTLYDSIRGSFFTFNLEKAQPTCDFYVAYCVNKDKEIKKIYVIPSVIMHGKKQLSIGQINSKYDKYIDAWDLIKEYDDFYERIKSR